MSTKSAIFTALESAGAKGITNSALYASGFKRPGARIHELRSEGIKIDTIHGPGAGDITYRLREDQGDTPKTAQDSPQRPVFGDKVSVYGNGTKTQPEPSQTARNRCLAGMTQQMIEIEKQHEEFERLRKQYPDFQCPDGHGDATPVWNPWPGVLVVACETCKRKIGGLVCHVSDSYV